MADDAEHDPRTDAIFREVSVERLVVREPGTGRVRAVVETVPVDTVEEDGYPVVRLALHTAAGDVALVAEVRPDGAARVTGGAGASVGGGVGGLRCAVGRTATEWRRWTRRRAGGCCCAMHAVGWWRRYQRRREVDRAGIGSEGAQPWWAGARSTSDDRTSQPRAI